jgi:uncharacterized protein YicC (UPF0701 family)
VSANHLPRGMHVDPQDKPIDLATNAVEAAKQKLEDVQQATEGQELTPDLDRQLDDAETELAVAEALKREIERRLSNPDEAASLDGTNDETIDSD